MKEITEFDNEQAKLNGIVFEDDQVEEEVKVNKDKLALIMPSSSEEESDEDKEDQSEES